MSKNKEEQALIPNDPNTVFGTLTPDTTEAIISHLPIKDIFNLIKSSITTHNFFKSSLIRLLSVKSPQDYVILGDLDKLILIAKLSPEVLFEKDRATDLRNRIFYHISAYQLILFYCDKDMENKIKPIIPERFDKIRKEQELEMGQGGNDLIKIDRDPLLIAKNNFKGTTEFKTTYTLMDGERYTVTLPLLENEDGILCYQDYQEEIHFYYANQKNQTITKLRVYLDSDEEMNAFEQFKASFNNMENNSGRRSSNAEHQLIAKILGITLQRQGILYEHHGKCYCDSVSPFNLINVYRRCIRLFNRREQKQCDKADACWRELGKVQGEEIWILQRICEPNRPFLPPPSNFDQFKRRVEFFNSLTGKYPLAIVNDKLVSGLGPDFTLIKTSGSARGMRQLTGYVEGVLDTDFVAILRLIKEAKKNIIKIEQERSWYFQENNRNMIQLNWN